MAASAPVVLLVPRRGHRQVSFLLLPLLPLLSEDLVPAALSSDEAIESDRSDLGGSQMDI